MKKLLIIILLALVAPHASMAARQVLSDGEGMGSVRSKINAMTSEVYTGKADKAQAVRYWADHADGTTLAVNTIVAYEGKLYNTTQSFLKTAGATPVGFSAYFSEVGGSGYTLPAATPSVLGGVKQGDRVTIAVDGTISADVQSGTGAVDSVNTKTGAVVINPDDLVDTTTTNKFVSAAQKALLDGANQFKLAGPSVGVNGPTYFQGGAVTNLSGLLLRGPVDLPSSGTSVMTLAATSGQMGHIPQATFLLASQVDAVPGGIMQWADAGTCSNPSYTTESTCESNSGTWTAVLAFPGTIDISDLTAASLTGNSKYYGTNSSGTRGVYDLPAASMTYPSTGNFGYTSNGTSWTAMGLDTDLATTSASDDTVPSAKAVKTALNAVSVAAPTVQSADPTSASAEGWYAATGSGDIFYKSSAGLFTIAGVYAADPTVPTLTSRVIGTNGTSLTLTGSASLSLGADADGSGFDVDCVTGGNGITATYASGAPGTDLVYTLGTTVNSGDTCDLDYNATGNTIQATTGGGLLASITSGAITNNSTQTSGSIPALSWNGDNGGGVLVAEKESGTVTGTLTTATTPTGSSDPGTASSDGGVVLKIPGAGSLRFIDTDIANMQSGYLSTLVYIPESVTGYNEFFEITDSTNSYYLYFSVTPDKHVRFQTTIPSTVQNDSTTVAFASGWHLFEARWSTTNTSVRVNGGSWETLNSGFTTAQTAGRVYLGYNSQIITNTIYIDGVELWDTYDQQ